MNPTTKMIRTESFELATFSRRGSDAPRLALLLPGRLDTKDYAHMRSHVELLAERGFFALSFDPPGTWESPGDISIYTMTNYLAAINELIEHFGNKPTLLVGHSRGGSMAMLAGTTNSKVTEFVTVFSRPGPSNIGLEEAKSKGVQVDCRDLPEKPAEQKRFELPYSYFEDAAQYDMRDGLGRCTKPKMFLVGLRDPDVRPEFAREAYEVSGEPKVMHELDSDHDYRHNQSVIDEVNRLLGDFLDSYPVGL